MREHQAYWDDFYGGVHRADVPETASSFAHWVAGRIDPTTLVADVGCGTARDSLWFADQGFEVRAYDYSKVAVDLGRDRAGRAGLAATFEVLDLYDAEAVSDLSRTLGELGRPIAIYGRFLLHALEDHGQRGLMDLAARTLSTDGSLFLEFRTDQDRDQSHVFGEHFRSYPGAAEVAASIETLGGEIVHREEGRGLAPYRDEDPVVCRIEARWCS